MKNASKFLIFFLLLGCNTKNKSRDQQLSGPEQLNILGFYEYQAPSGGSNHFILIDSLNNRYYGIYYRTAPKRGNGQEYYANSLSRFKFEGDSISFVLDERKLFNSRPVRPGKKTAANMPDIPLAVNRNALKFSGAFNREDLKLRCVSHNGNCPEQHMFFKRIPLPE